MRAVRRVGRLGPRGEDGGEVRLDVAGERLDPRGPPGLWQGFLGVGDRLHLLDPVRPDEVSAFVASADVGLLPLRHFGSHEMALANKLFEYL